MSVRQALASVLQLFTVFFFFGAGLFFLALPRSETLRLLCENLVWNGRSQLTSLGWGLILAAAVLLIGFYGIQRGRTLRIRMGGHSAQIDPLLIRQTIESHFNKKTSRAISFYDVEIGSGGKIEIAVAFQTVPEAELLKGMERELTSLLQARFGYAKPFHLIVRFRV